MSSTAKGHRNDGAKEAVKTVAFSELEIQAAARLLKALVGAEKDDRGRELTTLSSSSVEIGVKDRAILQERARQTYVARARRSHIFNREMFGEAAWDMLLALYVTDRTGTRHTVSGVVNLSGVPATSALRWLKFLEREQLVTRLPNRMDGRVIHVELTEKARELMDAYFSGEESEKL